MGCFLRLLSRHIRYSRIANLESDNDNRPGIIIQFSWCSLIVTLVALSTILVVTFAAGTHRVARALSPDSVIPVEKAPRVFRYNATFAERPSVITDSAWESLFPAQGGFFKHPTIAPERSAFAVFHQLHCLNGIREGFWVLHDAVMQGTKLDEHDLPIMSSPVHIRHCIDLLRQSLMCNPDLTVETKDKELGGVTGFGTEHQCRSWEQLVEWTTRWQTYEQDPSRGQEIH